MKGIKDKVEYKIYKNIYSCSRITGTNPNSIKYDCEHWNHRYEYHEYDELTDDIIQYKADRKIRAKYKERSDKGKPRKMKE